MLKKWGLTTEGEQPSKEAQPTPPMADLITSAGSIKSVDNSIFFYCDIHTQSCAELNRLLREVDNKLQQAKMIMNEEDFIPTIHLRINSYGGDLFAGISTVDTIRDLKSRVYTYVEGAAASAATIISIAGKKRFIGKNAFMLIHQLSSVCAGTYEQMNDGQENNKRLMMLIKNLYKQYTKIPMKELDSILKHDLWMDSDTCLKFGLVDKVI